MYLKYSYYLEYMYFKILPITVSLTEIDFSVILPFQFLLQLTELTLVCTVMCSDPGDKIN